MTANEIAKGFKHDMYSPGDMVIVKCCGRDMCKKISTYDQATVYSADGTSIDISEVIRVVRKS